MCWSWTNAVVTCQTFANRLVVIDFFDNKKNREREYVCVYVYVGLSVCSSRKERRTTLFQEEFRQRVAVTNEILRLLPAKERAVVGAVVWSKHRQMVLYACCQSCLARWITLFPSIDMVPCVTTMHHDTLLLHSYICFVSILLHWYQQLPAIITYHVDALCSSRIHSINLFQFIHLIYDEGIQVRLVCLDLTL